MATTISIQVGALIAQKVFQNDQLAGKIINEFYMSRGPGDDTATNQQKLNAVLDWFIAQLKDTAKVRYIHRAADTAMSNAESEYNLT